MDQSLLDGFYLTPAQRNIYQAFKYDALLFLCQAVGYQNQPKAALLVSLVRRHDSLIQFYQQSLPRSLLVKFFQLANPVIGVKL